MKKAIALVMGSMMAMSLAACGGSKPAATTAAPAETKAEAAAENKEAAAEVGGDIQECKFKISYATGDTGMDGVTAIEFERLIEEKSGGKIQIDRYPNCQLVNGDMQRHVESMIAGGAFEMAIISTTSFNVVNDDFSAIGVPFAFATYDDMWAAVDGEGGKYLEKIYADINIKYFSSFPNGLQHIANDKREVKTVADMKDLKMRTYGDTQMAMQRAMGADPVNMSWSELYSALQQKTVDGNTNGYQTLYSASMQEVQHYLTECGILASTYDFLMDKRVYDKLNADTQALFDECAKEAALYGRQYMNDQEAICKQAFIDAGCTITVLDEEALQGFKDAVKPVIDDMLNRFSDDCKKAWNY